MSHRVHEQPDQMSRSDQREMSQNGEKYDANAHSVDIISPTDFDDSSDAHTKKLISILEDPTVQKFITVVFPRYQKELMSIARTQAQPLWVVILNLLNNSSRSASDREGVGLENNTQRSQSRKPELPTTSQQVAGPKAVSTSVATTQSAPSSTTTSNNVTTTESVQSAEESSVRIPCTAAEMCPPTTPSSQTASTKSAPSSWTSETMTFKSTQAVFQEPPPPSPSYPSTAFTPGGSGDGNSGGKSKLHIIGNIEDRPKRPEYALKGKRLISFNGWPADHHLTKDEVSDAGFYYAGDGDRVRCFHCGGGLKNWDPDDDAWIEHARWFPKCAFIKQTKRQAFIDAVQKLKKTKDDISMHDVLKILTAEEACLDPGESALNNDPSLPTVHSLSCSE